MQLNITQLNKDSCNFSFILQHVMFRRFDLIRALLLSIFHWILYAAATPSNAYIEAHWNLYTVKKTMQLCHSYLSHTNELFYPFNFFLSCAMSVTHHNHIAFSLYLSVFHSNAAYLNKNQFPKRIKRSKYIHSINAILI